MTKINKKIRKAIIKQIKARGFTKTGNYYQKGSYRFKLKKESYRYERLIDTYPITWVKIAENRYEDIEV